MRKIVLCAVLGSLLAAGAVACSGAPGDEASEPTASAQAAASRPLIPSYVYGPDLSTFPDCERLEGNFAKPTAVLRLPDSDGAKYAPYYSDGYTVQFPTPWITQTGGSCPLALGDDGGLSQHCTVANYVYDFEQAIWAQVPGIVSHQFLVYDLTFDGKGYTVGNHQWFYNGTTDPGALQTMQQITQTYANEGIVQSVLKTCVYVFQQNGPNTIAATNYHSQVGQTHDPINWPN